MGPTKLLAGEGWIRAAAVAVGETVVPCDHRFVVRGGWDPAFVDPRFLDTRPSGIDRILGPGKGIDASLELGGCNADTTRPVVSNLALAYAQGQLAEPLCADGDGVLPPSWDGDMAAALDHLGAAILSRRIETTERTELLGEMHACISAGSCTTDESAVRWMCRRMLDSVEFGTY
jgi:hypothetical protein